MVRSLLSVFVAVVVLKSGNECRDDIRMVVVAVVFFFSC